MTFSVAYRCLFKACILSSLLLFAYGNIAPGHWTGNQYKGQLDMTLNMLVTGCTIEDVGYIPEDLTKKSAADNVLWRTIAGSIGVQKGDIEFEVTEATGGIKVEYEIKAEDVTDFAQASSHFTEIDSEATVTNLMQLFAALDSNAPLCMGTATAGSFVTVSSVGTFAPTNAPTMAPTPFTAEQFGFLLNKYLVASIVIGSILGIMLLYYGYWGLHYLLQWLEERQRLLDMEHEQEVDEANRKLHEKFVKGDVEKSPHTSKMRENFRKQFGTAPSEQSYTENASDGTLITNMSVGASIAPRGGQLARTLATKLPGSSSPPRGPRPRGGQAGYRDVETGESKVSPPRTPVLDSGPDYYHGPEEKSNRLAEGSGVKFGFAAD